MKPEERLQTVTAALAERDPHSNLDPQEVAKLTADLDIDPNKVIGTMIYVKARLVEKISRIKSFERAFPERCVATVADADTAFGTTAKLGEKLHKSTIDVKAKRLEASPHYKQIWTILQSSLYVQYATDRLLVLDESLRKIFDMNVADRDKAVYMKLFLEETRKPAEAAKMELNLSLTSNTVNVIDIEQKMTDIAKQMEGKSAGNIIDMVSNDDHRAD